MPHLFWSNAIPDANVVVDLTVNGTSLKFTDGVGYHDKNWGDASISKVGSSWSWGHARFGPYSVVWFDALDKAGAEHVAGYATHEGRVIQSSCVDHAVVVRPWGFNSTYPPKVMSGLPQGLEARFDLGNGETLVANVTTKLTVAEQLIYSRALAKVEGGVEGSRDEFYPGRAIYEQLVLS
jgi:hypothetical protein